MNPLARAIIRGAAAPSVLTLPSANLLASWDARVGVTEAGTGVSSWVSSPGSYDAVQATDAKRPSLVASALGGKPVIRFTGANADALIVTSMSDASTSYTIYMVANITTPSSQVIFWDSQSGRIFLDGDGVSSRRYFDGTYRTIGGAPSGTHAFTTVIAGTTVTGYEDGVSTGSSACTARSIGGKFAIGANVYASNNPTCDIASLFVYTAAHDSTQRAAVHAYIAQEWGV